MWRQCRRCGSWIRALGSCGACEMEHGIPKIDRCHSSHSSCHRVYPRSYSAMGYGDMLMHGFNMMEMSYDFE